MRPIGTSQRCDACGNAPGSEPEPLAGNSQQSCSSSGRTAPRLVAESCAAFLDNTRSEPISSSRSWLTVVPSCRAARSSAGFWFESRWGSRKRPLTSSSRCTVRGPFRTTTPELATKSRESRVTSDRGVILSRLAEPGHHRSVDDPCDTPALEPCTCSESWPDRRAAGRKRWPSRTTQEAVQSSVQTAESCV